MPHFILDHGSTEAAIVFSGLNRFTQGYVEAIFFTSTGNLEDSDLEQASFAELAPETLATIVRDCAAFLSAAPILDTADDETQRSAGADFWYTRNGHGSGFWDGDWPEPMGSFLTDVTKRFGTQDIYRGDDGRLYLA